MSRRKPIQKPIQVLTCRGLALLLLAATSPAAAYDYQGRVEVGAYVAHEDLPEQVTGSGNNDMVIYSARANLAITSIGETRYEFVTDVRDNHDVFDKVDAQRLQLDSVNTFRLRQLVWRDPGVVHPYFWSIGRFLPADNNVFYNDGVEVGYKVTAASRIGVFGGYRPRINDEQAVELTPTAYQAGVYHVYQTDGLSWVDAKYMSNMLVYAPKFFLEGNANGLQPVETVAYINQGIWRFDQDDRVTTFVNLQAEPEVRAEDLVVSYDHRFNRDFSLLSTASRLDLTEYRNQRDILETIPASAYEQAKTSLRYRATDQLRVDGNLLYGTRNADDLRRYEASLGATLSKILGGMAAANALAGYRRNFISRDDFASLGLSLFSRDWELDGDLRLTLQNRDDGDVLHQLVTAVNLGYYFSRYVIGTIGAEYAHDEKVTVTSGMLTLGYRFGNREFVPLRDVAPPAMRF